MIKSIEPKLSEIRRADEVGRVGHTHSYIWIECPDCKKQRWVLLRNSKPVSTICKCCIRRGPRHENWKGKEITKEGYIRIRLMPDDPFYPMAEVRRSRIMEHRYIVAKALDRCLEDWELVHHKGERYPKDSIENRQDNRYPENLELTANGEHVSQHQKEKAANGIDPFHGNGYRRKYN